MRRSGEKFMKADKSDLISVVFRTPTMLIAHRI